MILSTALRVVTKTTARHQPTAATTTVWMKVVMGRPSSMSSTFSALDNHYLTANGRRLKSSVAVDDQVTSITAGIVEKPLRALDMRAVRQIKAELMAVDANSDGRYVLCSDVQRRLTRCRATTTT